MRLESRCLEAADLSHDCSGILLWSHGSSLMFEIITPSGVLAPGVFLGCGAIGIPPRFYGSWEPGKMSETAASAKNFQNFLIPILSVVKDHHYFIDAALTFSKKSVCASDTLKFLIETFIPGCKTMRPSAGC